MQEQTQHHINKEHICELCQRHDPLVKNYAEDFELQTALRDYIEKTTGDRVAASDVARLCDSCYTRINDTRDEEEDDR